MGKGQHNPGADLLALRPATARKWERGEDGLVRILIPRFTGRLLGRWLMPRLKKPYFKLKLDEIGSFIWERCDGMRTGEEIAGLLAKQFPDLEDASNRLGQFLAMLFSLGHVVNPE